MAIVGFIFTFIFAPLGFIFSLIGYAQTQKDTTQGGKGLALAGTIISLLLILVAVILIVTNLLDQELYDSI